MTTQNTPDNDTGSAGELDEIFERFEYQIVNSKVTEDDWKAQIYFKVTSEAKADIQKLISRYAAQAVRQELLAIRGEIDAHIAGLEKK